MGEYQYYTAAGYLRSSEFQPQQSKQLELVKPAVVVLFLAVLGF